MSEQEAVEAPLTKEYHCVAGNSLSVREEICVWVSVA